MAPGLTQCLDYKVTELTVLYLTLMSCASLTLSVILKKLQYHFYMYKFLLYKVQLIYWAL